MNLANNSSDEKINNNKHDYLIISLLFLIGLLNHIDRYIVTGLFWFIIFVKNFSFFFFFEYIIGVLNEIIDFYKIDDSLAELIQLILNFGFIISAPLFGYLGDKYKRKWIITFGICFWSLMNLIGSFIPANVII